MRYVRQKQIIATVCDTTLIKTEDILLLLKKIKAESAEFILILKKSKVGLAPADIHTHNKVKIKSINSDNTVDFLVFTKSSTAVLRDIKIEEIDTIQSVFDAGTSHIGTANSLKKDIIEILNGDSETSRFGMMDLDGSNTGD
jgi:hypothetical protein